MKWNATLIAFMTAFFSKANAVVAQSVVPPIPIQPKPAPASYLTPLYSDPFKHALDHIQYLRKEEQLDEALSYINRHLNAYPNDIDVTLLKGFVLYQKKQYAQASQCFQQVLEKIPTYIDAQMGLVNIEIAQKHYEKASSLLQTSLQSAPKNERLLALKTRLERIISTYQHAIKTAPKPLPSPIDTAIASAQTAAQQHAPWRAKILLKKALMQHPGDDRLCVALADQYLALHQDLAALSTVNRCLKHNPNAVMLHKKLGELFILLVEYPQAAFAYQQALALKPNDEGTQGALNDLRALTPYYTYGLNEIGLFSDNTYVNDLHSIWNYSSLFFNRNISFGRVGWRVNDASRLGQNAAQLQIDFSPRYNRQLYFDFSAAYANKPELFPDWMAYGEAYYNVPEFLEFSAGMRYSNIGPTYFTTYTASMNKYTEHYLFSFRPYYFVPKTHDTTVLYTGTLRRYFETLDHFVSVNIGAGKSPDLSDLLTVNFIKIRNYFAFLNYEFPIVNHHVIVDVGAGYQLWQYPNGLNRNLYDGLFGIKYRFG